MEQCLYRLSSTGMYYAVVRHGGKIYRRNPETTSKSIAKRKIDGELRKITSVDATAGKLTLLKSYGSHAQRAIPTLERVISYFEEEEDDFPKKLSRLFLKRPCGKGRACGN